MCNRSDTCHTAWYINHRWGCLRLRIPRHLLPCHHMALSQRKRTTPRRPAHNHRQGGLRERVDDRLPQRLLHESRPIVWPCRCKRQHAIPSYILARAYLRRLICSSVSFSFHFNLPCRNGCVPPRLQFFCHNPQQHRVVWPHQERRSDQENVRGVCGNLNSCRLRRVHFQLAWQPNPKEIRHTFS